MARKDEDWKEYLNELRIEGRRLRFEEFRKSRNQRDERDDEREDDNDGEE